LVHESVELSYLYSLVAVPAKMAVEPVDSLTVIAPLQAAPSPVPTADHDGSGP
jgi:hypothetical protein